jgi:hypothetical protein
MIKNALCQLEKRLKCLLSEYKIKLPEALWFTNISRNWNEKKAAGMGSISDAPPIELLSYLPGRARVQLTKTHLTSLNKWRDFQSDLATAPGIHTVKTNPVTGQVLIIFDPNSAYRSSKQLVPTINCVLTGNLAIPDLKRLPKTSWLGTVKGQAINVLAYGFILIYSLVTKLFTGGHGSTALSPVFLIQSSANVLSGYPFLR